MAKSKDSKRSNDDRAKQIVAHVVAPEVERGNLELFHTPSRAAFATVKVRDHRETLEVNGAEFKDLLSYWIYKTEGEMPTDALLKKIIRVLRGQALYDGPECRVFHRIAEAGGSIFLDLSDEAWRVVEIAPGGWSLAKNPSVRFVRSSVSLPLPMPERGGNLEDLFDLVNLDKREHRVLFLACLVAALQTHASYPVLMLTGSQGSAKSTACRIAAGLIDPSEPQLVSGFTHERDLLIDAQFSHIIAIDNQSEIKDQFSDALCRLSTGSGSRRRKLYTDSTLFSLSAKNPVILNAIGQPATRGDLLDRMIVLRLDPIPESKRREEAQILAEFRAKRPALLGALLTVVSAALAKLPHLKRVENLPRMADFSVWILSCEKELGFCAGEFLAAYRSNRAEASDSTLEFSPVGLPVIQLVDENKGTWEGSVKDLLAALNAKFGAETRNPDWPKNPKALRSELHRIDANLHAAGYHFQPLKRDPYTRRRLLRIKKKPKASTVEFPSADAEAGAGA